ncbi:MAG: NUDIX domain-containing protein [Rickettsiales bacterium]
METNGKTATTTIVTFTDPETKKDYVLLCVPDPRTRIARDGTYQGLPALNADDTPNLLPLDQLKFIGGYIDPGETVEAAGLRELAEEAGPALAEMVERTGFIKPAYCMTRRFEQDDARPLKLHYLHAHLGERTMSEVKQAIASGPTLAAVEEALEPSDDVFAIVIAEVDKIKRTPGGYVVEAGLAGKKLAQQFRPIDYAPWHALTSETSRRAYDTYNRLGATDPYVGLDIASLGKQNIILYTPTKADHSLQCAADASVPYSAMYGGSGAVCPDGAIFTDLVRPQLALLKQQAQRNV